jgi:hypothetical protein
MPVPSMRRRLPSIAILAACAATTLHAAAAHEPGAHVHGVAELRVVVDGARLEATLESPLDNLLGFEHAPRTDAQRDAVRAMAATLRGSPGPLTPTAAARCTLESVHLASSALPAVLLGETAAAAAPADAQEGHADLDASFTWRCEAPAQLAGLDVGLMHAFPRIRRLDAQVVGPKGQSATQLSAARPALRW